MLRRDFLRSAAAVSAGFVFPRPFDVRADTLSDDNWRTFEIRTRVQVLKPAGTTRVWLPAALITVTPFQRTLSNEFDAEGGTARLVESDADALGIVAAEFPAGVEPVLTLTSRVATRNYVVDLSTAGSNVQVHPRELDISCAR